MTAGSIGGQGLVVLITPWLATWYAPADFGIAASVVAMAAILLPWSTLRLEQAIPRAGSQREAAILMIVALTSIGIWTALSALVVGVIAGFFPNLRYLAWLPAFVLTIAAFQVGHYWLLRERSYRVIGIGRVVSGATQAIGQGVGGLQGMGANGLLLGDLLGRTVSGLRVLGSVWRSRMDFSGIRLDETRQILRANRDQWTFGLLIGIMSLVTLQAPILALAWGWGEDQAGQLTVAQRIGAVPVALIAASLGQALYPRFITWTKESPAWRRERFSFIVRRLAVLGVLSTAGLMAFAHWVFPLLFGPSWDQARGLLMVLAVVAGVEVAVTPLAWLLVAFRRQKTACIWEASRLLGVMTIFLAGRFWEWSSVWTMAGFAAVMVSSYAVQFLLCWSSVAVVSEESLQTKGQ